ncbi:MAG: Lon-like protease helical domain-containing protein, partial [Desulfatiglandaceae bacterium]
MAKNFPEVPAEELRATIDSETLPFENTATLKPIRERVLGQKRAIEAIQFGMGMKTGGYHIYIAGPPKTGLTYIARTYLEKQAKKEPKPPDWCYVYNFKEPDKPKSLKLQAGQGKKFKKDMQEFIRTLQTKILEVFDSDDYRAKESELQQAFERRRRKITDEMSELAKQEGFILQISQVGMVIIPANKDGQPMSQEELAQLGDDEKKRLRD